MKKLSCLSMPLEKSPRVFLAAFILAVLLNAYAIADDARLPRPSYAEAAALLRAGKAGEALDDLDKRLIDPAQGDWPPEVFALRAAILNEAGRVVEAEAYWLLLANREPVLNSYSLRHVVNGRIDQGDLE